MSPPPPSPWNDPRWLQRVDAFAGFIGLGQKHRGLLIQALTHRSLKETSPHGDNERLEFLGDSILALCVTTYLYRTHPTAPEGQLTRLKIRYVSEPALTIAAGALGLGGLIALTPGEDAAGGRLRPSTLSDAFEAVLGALYLARGFDAAQKFVIREVIARIDPDEISDHKSTLQELLQEARKETPVYQTGISSGPAHERVFRSLVLVGEEVLGEGEGRSKKLAEQSAAASALESLTAGPAPKRARPGKSGSG